MLQLVTRFAEEVPQSHRHKFQMGQQALELGRGQCGEQVVLIGTMRAGHGGTWTGVECNRAKQPSLVVVPNKHKSKIKLYFEVPPKAGSAVFPRVGGAAYRP
jgi:hypothetical protein